MMEYLDFELRIGLRSDDDGCAVTATSDIGLAEGTSQFDIQQLISLQSKLATRAAHRTRWVSPVFREAQDFGNLLFRSLPEKVRGHYALYGPNLTQLPLNYPGNFTLTEVIL